MAHMAEGYTVIGKRIRMQDGPAKVTGAAKYGADFKLPGMLHARILGSPHAHAEIVKIDTSKAEALPGVRAVITRKDVPEAIADVGFYLGQPLFPDKARRVGDAIAAVAADTEEIAEEALDLIEVEYNVLTPVYDPEEALKPGAPEIHTKGNLERIIAAEMGDLNAGFAGADFVIERTFNFPGHSRASIGRATTLVDVRDDGVTCYAADPQEYWVIQRNVARGLGVPLDKVRVICLYSAGNYGSKEERQHVQAALLSRKAKRPVRLGTTRKEEIEGGTRPIQRFYIKVGVKNDGTITALDVKTYSSCGAYTGAAVENAAGLFFCDLYQPLSWKFETLRAFTNTITTCDYRGYGHPQPNFVIETIVDEIAERLDIDPSEYRFQHLIQAPADSVGTANGITSEGFRDSIIKGREMIGWNRWQPPAGKTGTKRRGLGVATHIKGVGGTSVGDTVFVRITREGKVVLALGSGNYGCGHLTAYPQIVAEVLRVPPDDVRAVWGDTDDSPYGVSSSGASRCMYNFGNTSYDAAVDVKRLLFQEAAKLLKVDPEALETNEGVIYVKAEPDKKVTFSDVGKKGELVGIGRMSAPERWIPHTKPTINYFYTQTTTGSCWAEVEVDTETGGVEVIHMAYAYDVGTVVNPDIVDGQLEGGGAPAIGYALREGWVRDEASGYYLNSHFFDNCKVPGPGDTPKVSIAYIDVWDPVSRVGAKGIGEGATIAPFSVVAMAIYNAIGVRFYEPPITPEKILKALGKAV